MTGPEQPNAGSRRAPGAADLESGRESYARGAWREAHARLARADAATRLDAEDLERMAIAAYMVGRENDYLGILERAHGAYLEAGKPRRAARCAFWSGLRLALRGEIGRANGWFARARRLLEDEQIECVEHGYLRLAAVQQHVAAGDWTAAADTAAGAAKIGERFGDADLTACARHLQGRALIMQGRIAAGLALLDETMLLVTSGELSPIVTGLVYCNVIEGCQQIYALDRAREWTAALAAWCARQPDMNAFHGTCRVHRAEIMQWYGEWDKAIEEARLACTALAAENDRRTRAVALYRQGEIHRLRGALAAAEQAYRRASDLGEEPQPGMALLRLAQAQTDAAAAAIRRVLGAATDPLQRTRLLPAYVEIMLAIDDTEAAHAASRELDEISRRFDLGVVHAMAAHVRGTVALAQNDAAAGLRDLRAAWQTWRRIDAPYAGARTRFFIALACRALGDDDGADLELNAARAIFERLGAIPDLARIDALGARPPAVESRGLSARELQVLRRVAAGKTNKAIAGELGLSEKTIDRHVSNIFTKLGVSSRAAATAHAYRFNLIS